MAEGLKIDAVLTDDESELLTIIHGLEDQANLNETYLKKVQQLAQLTFLGAIVSMGLAATESSSNGKQEYIAISAVLAIGGIDRVFEKLRTEKEIRSKNLLANKLKRELNVTDLDRYEHRDIYVPEEDDEDDPEEDFLFT